MHSTAQHTYCNIHTICTLWGITAGWLLAVDGAHTAVDRACLSNPTVSARECDTQSHVGSNTATVKLERDSGTEAVNCLKRLMQERVLQGRTEECNSL